GKGMDRCDELLGNMGIGVHLLVFHKMGGIGIVIREDEDEGKDEEEEIGNEEFGEEVNLMDWERGRRWV
ncbi:hypothetical protein, partial [Paenibacillus sp. Y412MC10]|uniref:hypothetical protein n=1 Tax=Geobacillus sp. (strain Y412MC10) TaxID=481743 RepID=UPI001642739C